MSGVVHFKLKSSNSYDSVGFDGAFISVGELKVLIAEKKGLSKDATSELLLSDPRTQVSCDPLSSIALNHQNPLIHKQPCSFQFISSHSTRAPTVRITVSRPKLY